MTLSMLRMIWSWWRTGSSGPGAQKGHQVVQEVIEFNMYVHVINMDIQIPSALPLVAAAAGGSQDLTRRLTWGALSAKLNETTTLMPHISRTEQIDNMNFSTRIRKIFWVRMKKVGTHAKILCCWALCEHVNSAHVCIPGITGEKTHA